MAYTWECGERILDSERFTEASILRNGERHVEKVRIHLRCI